MKHVSRWLLTLCLLLAAAVIVPGPSPARAAMAGTPCDGTHAGWTAIADLDDLAASCSTLPVSRGGQEAQYVLKAGRYYLTADLELDTFLSLAAGVNLCLNGHTITTSAIPPYANGATAYYMINCFSTAANPVNLSDCTGEGNLFHNIDHRAVLNAAGSGSTNLFGVNVKNSKARYGAVWVETGATLNMYSGEITGNHGTFLDKAGTAEESVSGSACGGVYVRSSGDKIGTFNLFGGSIHDNYSGVGNETERNVFVYTAGGAVFHYAGGSLTRGVLGTLSFPVSVNGEALSVACDGGEVPASYSDDNVEYDVATSTLTVKKSDGITALDWTPGFDLTIKLEDDLTDVAGFETLAAKGLILDLNGHTLAKSDLSAGSQMNLTGGATLVLKDSSADQSGAISGYRIHLTGGQFTMESGTLTQGRSIGNNAGGAMYIAANGSFTMNGGVISDAVAGTAGGGVCVNGGLFTMNDGVISGCTTGGSQNGGGVYVTGNGTFIMNGGTVTGNAAHAGGGGVSVNTGTVQLLGGAVTGNTSGTNGGGVSAICTAEGANSRIILDGGTISNNVAGTSGGGIGMVPACKTVVQIKSGLIDGNTAQGGGGLYLTAPGAVISGGTISNNTASYPERENGTGGYAAAIQLTSTATLTMEDGLITGNHSNGFYGSIFTYGAPFVMNGGAITNNTQTLLPGATGGFGVAVVVDGSGSFTMNGGTISGNEGDWQDGQLHKIGGAVSAIHADSVLRLNGGEISGNTTVKGAVYLRSGTLYLAGTRIVGNTAAQVSGGLETKQNGGGIYMDGASKLTVSDGEVSGNLGATGRDIFPTGSNCSVTVTGGVIGAKEDIGTSLSFWVYRDGSAGATTSISGGTLYSGFGMGGSAPNTATITGGKFRTVSISTSGTNSVMNVSNALFMTRDITAGSGTINFPAGQTLVPSGDAEFPHALGVAVTGVTLDKSTLSLQAGKTAALTATVTPADAAFKSVTWTTNNAAAATVDGSGVVTGVAMGTAIITVTTADGSFTASCIVTVTAPDPSVEPELPGDLNGDDKLNAKDVVLLQRYLAGGYGMTLDEDKADLNGDGKLNAKDVVTLQRYLAGGYGIVLN